MTKKIEKSRRADYSDRAGEIAKYKVELDIAPTSSPGWQNIRVIVNGVPYAEAEAKVYDVGSEYGINHGRVSKLALNRRDYRTGLISQWLAHYDRGWDREPMIDIDKACVLAIINAFPEPATNNEEGGTR